MTDNPRDMLVALKVVQPPSLVARMSDREVKALWTYHQAREMVILNASYLLMYERYPDTPIDDLSPHQQETAVKATMKLIADWKPGTGRPQTEFNVCAMEYYKISDEMTTFYSRLVERLGVTGNVVPFDGARR